MNTQLKKKFAAALLSVPLFVLSGCSEPRGVIYTNREQEGQRSVTETQPFTEKQPSTELPENLGYVYVCGAVNSPGVYPVHQDMRIFEAIELAGGFAGNAACESINQAAPVQDGQRLYIYSVEEISQSSEQLEGRMETSAEASQGKVNLNTAGREELMELPGIGQAKAEAILQYRSEHGAFQSIEEITNIAGIKNAVFSKIQDLIFVG